MALLSSEFAQHFLLPQMGTVLSLHLVALPGSIVTVCYSAQLNELSEAKTETFIFIVLLAFMRATKKRGSRVQSGHV